MSIPVLRLNTTGYCPYCKRAIVECVECRQNRYCYACRVCFICDRDSPRLIQLARKRDEGVYR